MGAPPVVLDREAYAKARASGLNKAESARRAGSRANSTEALSNAGKRLEDKPAVQELISEEKQRRLDQIEDAWSYAWDIARAKLLHRIQDDSNANAQLRAIELVARVQGRFVDRHEVTAVQAQPVSVAEMRSLLSDPDISRQALDAIERMPLPSSTNGRVGGEGDDA